MADQRIAYTERMVGTGHPTFSDTLNRLTLVGHNSDGSHKGYVEATQEGNLTATLAAVPITTMVVITNDQTLYYGTTIEHPIHVLPGATLITNTGTTIFNGPLAIDGGGALAGLGAYAINGSFTCSLCQCFTGSGAVTFGSGSVTEVYPEWWGAKPDGVTACTDAIRSALDAGPVKLSRGVYGVDNLQIKTGDIICGSGATFWQTVGAKPDGSAETILKYIGTGGVNSVCLRAAIQDVGDATKPSIGQDTFSWKITDLIIDGDETSEFGLYGARCGLGTVIDRVVLTGCKEHGVWFNDFWTSEIRSLYAIWNGGRGITIGHNTFGWSSSAVNAISINTIQAFENGNDLTDWTQADYLKGYGMYLGFGRGCVAENLIGEYNSGVGIVVAPSAGSNSIHGYYCENNCNIAASMEDRYQLWFQSVADSANMKISSGYYLYNVVAPSGNDNAPRIRITGTPTTPASVPIFSGWQGGAVVNADFGEYRIENVSLVGTIRIISFLPLYSDSSTITTSGGGWTSSIYVNETATGTGSGIDTSNYAVWGTALKAVKVCSSLTTINNSAVTSSTGIASAPVIDGSGVTQRVTIDGATTGRLAFVSASSRGATIQNWSTELSIVSQALTEFLFVKDSKIVLHNNVLMRMNTSTTSGAAIDIDNSQVQITGTSAIDLTSSTAATKVGINASGGSIVWFTGDAAAVITNESASSNVVMSDVAVVKDSTGWRLATF